MTSRNSFTGTAPARADNAVGGSDDPAAASGWVFVSASTPGAADPRLMEAEARLGGLTANLPGFVFQRAMAPDGGIRYPWISDSVEPVLGFAAAAMGVNSKGCLHVIHWADRDPHLEEIRRSALSLDTCRDEFRAITATGEVRWLRGASQPRRMADGTVLWDGVVVDVTEGRRAELRLDMLMDHADDSILVLDSQGNIDTVNVAAERLFGRTAAEMIGQPFSILLPPERRSEANVDRAMKLLNRTLAAVEAHMKGRDFLAGAFSAADTITGHACIVAARLGADMSALPNVAAYNQRLTARPALQAAWDA